MDKHTFGNRKTAIILAELLTQENNNTYSRKVSRTLGTTHKTINELKNVNDITVKRHLTKLYRNNLLKNVNDFDLPLKIKTYLLCETSSIIKEAFQ